MLEEPCLCSNAARHASLQELQGTACSLTLCIRAPLHRSAKAAEYSSGAAALPLHNVCWAAGPAWWQ